MPALPLLKLVRGAHLLLICAMPLSAAAQTPAPAPAQAPAAPARPFAILDNSFLVEEAFNQEAGIFQSIFGFQRGGGAWDFAFTQEWPLTSQAHQVSFSLPMSGVPGVRGRGDLALHYRYQATAGSGGGLAFSPRVSVILPTGADAFTNHAAGVQINLPFSRQFGDIYVHANAGATWFPRAKAGPTGPIGSPGQSLLSPHVAGSAIVRVRQMFNLMVESVVESDQALDATGARSRQTVFTLSPGARGGWNLGDQQVILGAAVPITWAGTDRSAGILLYLSYERPFRKNAP